MSLRRNPYVEFLAAVGLCLEIEPLQKELRLNEVIRVGS